MAFIDAHRDAYGVEPICAVWPIAPSTYYTYKAQQADPERRCVRARRDEGLRGHIRQVWTENFEVYGVRKVWRELRRREEPVARCTVARLMDARGSRARSGAGSSYGRRSRTTPPRARGIWSAGSSGRRGQISCGWPT